PKVSEVPTDPRRPAAQRPGTSSGTNPAVLILAAVVVLLLGGVGGAFIFRSMQQPAQPPPVAATVVRFSLTADRPVTVFLGKQELGPTPLNVFIPSGKHQLELREADGARRALEVNLPPTEPEAKLIVTLDSLPALP
ncbi:MAG TPA: hypothetical protein VGE37_06980, partial [Archangium sp.]